MCQLQSVVESERSYMSSNETHLSMAGQPEHTAPSPEYMVYGSTPAPTPFGPLLGVDVVPPEKTWFAVPRKGDMKARRAAVEEGCGCQPAAIGINARGRTLLIFMLQYLVISLTYYRFRGMKN
jgi:hypothetical protein